MKLGIWRTGILALILMTSQSVAAFGVDENRIPVTPDAKDATRDEQSGCASDRDYGVVHIVRFSSVLNSDEIDRFYQSEMPKIGWSLGSSTPYEDPKEIVQSWTNESLKLEATVKIQENGSYRWVDASEGSSEFKSCGGSPAVIVLVLLVAGVALGGTTIIVLRKKHLNKQ